MVIPPMYVPYWVKVLAVLKNDRRTVTQIVANGELATYSQASAVISMLAKHGIVKRIPQHRNVLIQVNAAYKPLVNAARVVVEYAAKENIQKT